MIFMYAVGAPSAYRDPCQRILEAGATGETVLVTSAETLQEVLHRYRSLGRISDVGQVFVAIAASTRQVLPVTAEDVEEARRLGEAAAVSDVSARDLVHAAVARRQGIREILTTDRHFASIPSVAVVDPLTWEGSST